MTHPPDRRDFLKASAGLAAGAAVGVPLLPREAAAQQLSFKPEPGARLRVLRWKRFVQGDEDAWAANTRKFSEATGVPVVGRGPGLYPEHFTRAVGPERPSAGWLARAVVEEAAELLDPEPLYLRRPDAVAGSPRKPVS